MTEDEFRALALALPEAEEQSHMEHPDFRVGGKIFATLRYPEPGWAMVKLNLEQREAYVEIAPRVFSPVEGGWGRHGATRVQLSAATTKVVRGALAAAWKNVAPKRLTRA